MEQQAYRDQVVNVQNSGLGMSRLLGAAFNWGKTVVRSVAASVWLGFQIFVDGAEQSGGMRR